MNPEDESWYKCKDSEMEQFPTTKWSRSRANQREIICDAEFSNPTESYLYKARIRVCAVMADLKMIPSSNSEIEFH